MRKTMMICLLVLLGSLASNAQSQPQWVVVYSAVLLDQTEAIPETTAFTPTEAGGAYRLSACLSEPEDAHNAPTFELSWGKTSAASSTAVVNAGQQTTFVFMPRAGVPVSYASKGARGHTGEYDVAFTIEQLQNSNQPSGGSR